MTPLGPGFLRRPIAHRGLHDRAAGRPENSLAAARAAVDAGYGIEIDLQPAACGTPMVFHDGDLARMTGSPGPIRAQPATALQRLRLQDSQERIPTLAELLDLVAGQVPLLIEIKDQPGDPRRSTAPLTEATLQLLSRAGYGADGLALMSFNPFAVVYGATRRPDLAWGVTTGESGRLWPEHPALEQLHITGGIDPADYGASFVSHGLKRADAPWLAPLRARGVPVLSWTVRSPEEAKRARAYAQNITFEGFRPPLALKQA